MLGDFHLRFLQHLLEVTNAKRTIEEQMENPQTGAITEASINFDEVHSMNMPA